MRPRKLCERTRASSPPPSSRRFSEESLRTPGRASDAAFRPSRRFPATPSSADDRRRESTGTEIRPKSHISLSSLSDFNGSEDSHTERRFLRHYEELESRCSGNLMLFHGITQRTVSGLYYPLVSAAH